MADNTENTPNQPETLNPRDDRRARRRESRSGGTLIIGAILVALGILFLFQNMGTIILTNWWALFILIPALIMFQQAWESYKDAGRLSRRARGLILVGLILVLVVIGFVFEVSWNYYGPILLILGGAGILVNMLIPGEEA
jgi:peptidoglycan/LPS O-acetylase OafA/YrhL